MWSSKSATWSWQPIIASRGKNGSKGGEVGGVKGKVEVEGGRDVGKGRLAGKGEKRGEKGCYEGIEM